VVAATVGEPAQLLDPQPPPLRPVFGGELLEVEVSAVRSSRRMTVQFRPMKNCFRARIWRR